MKLTYHIANRLINDPTFMDEIMETQVPHWAKLLKATKEEQDNLIEADPKASMEAVALYDLLNPRNCKYYFITSTVLNQLDHLKVSKKEVDGHGLQYDWTVFRDIPESKKAFIFGTGSMFIFQVKEDNICMFYGIYDTGIKNTFYAHANWTILFADRKTGTQAEHFDSDQARAIDEVIYKLLCFFYLTENTEEILKPGERRGTKKNGKLINDLKVPLTVVTSKWNITSIRTEGFSVSGHLAIRWTGEGRKIAKIVFIPPFEKKGYIRKAKKETVKNP